MKEFRTAGATGMPPDPRPESFLTSLLVARETPEKVSQGYPFKSVSVNPKIGIVILMNVGCGSSLIVSFLATCSKATFECEIAGIGLFLSFCPPSHTLATNRRSPHTLIASPAFRPRPITCLAPLTKEPMLQTAAATIFYANLNVWL